MTTTRIEIPANALVITLGPAGCGKSTFCEVFPGNAVVSSDVCRALITDDATNQDANKQAFELFHFWIKARLKQGRLAVADATNLTPRARKTLRDIAAEARVPVIVLRFATDLDTCLAQNRQRDRFVPEHVIRTHYEQYEIAREAIGTEGYAAIHTINPLREYEIVINGGARTLTAPGFDIIGDIHGCTLELNEMLLTLGYDISWITGVEGEGSSYVHPDGRKLVFVGDITDRGPDSVATLRMVKLALEGGHYAVMGNHDNKLMRALKGNKVKAGHGLQGTLDQIEEQCSPAEKQTFLNMLQSLPYQLSLKVEGHPDVVVSHAGIPPELVGKDNSFARNHALFGEVLGFLEDGMPDRGTSYRHGWLMGDDKPYCVHGHTVVPDPEFLFCNVFDIDQGCVFGGKLTALRVPEMTFVQVPAKATYSEK